METEILQVAKTVSTQVFEGTRKYTDVFVPILFVGRIGFANLLAQDEAEYLAALKGLVIYFVLMACFGPLMDIVFAIPDAFSWNHFLGSTTGVSKVDANSLNQAIEDQSMDFGFYIRRFFELMTIGAYYVAMVLHVLVTIVFAAMYPIFISLAVMLGVGVGARVFIGMMVIASCWPLLFVSFDYLSVVLAKSPKFSGKTFIIVEMIIQMLKVTSPLALGAMALRSAPGQAVASGLRGMSAQRSSKFTMSKGDTTSLASRRGRTDWMDRRGSFGRTGSAGVGSDGLVRAESPQRDMYGDIQRDMQADVDGRAQKNRSEDSTSLKNSSERGSSYSNSSGSNVASRAISQAASGVASRSLSKFKTSSQDSVKQNEGQSQARPSWLRDAPSNKVQGRDIPGSSSTLEHSGLLPFEGNELVGESNIVDSNSVGSSGSAKTQETDTVKISDPNRNLSGTSKTNENLGSKNQNRELKTKSVEALNCQEGNVPRTGEGTHRDNSSGERFQTNSFVAKTINPPTSSTSSVSSVSLNSSSSIPGSAKLGPQVDSHSRLNQNLHPKLHHGQNLHPNQKTEFEEALKTHEPSRSKKPRTRKARL